MKTLMIPSVLLFVILGMVPRVFASISDNPPDTLHIESAAEANDSLEYDLIILDPGFNFWFVTTKKGEWYYTQEYLEHWNSILVSQWNNQTGLSGRRGRGCIPDMYIHYDTSINYGKTLNYKLFYYFRYVEEQCRLFSSIPGKWR